MGKVNEKVLLRFKEHIDSGEFVFVDKEDGGLKIDLNIDEDKLKDFLKLYKPLRKRISKKLLDSAFNDIMETIVNIAVSSKIQKESSNEEK